MSSGYLGIYAKFASGSDDWTARRFALQAAARVLLPAHRVCDCCRKPVPGASAVELWYSDKVQAAHYKQLQTCGAVWVCPVCAARITERRRVELQRAIDNGVYRPVLVTLTVRHAVGDALVALLDGLLDAYRVFVRGRAYQSAKREYGIVGTVRALEVTCGDNGWHPHLHLLVFMRSGDTEAFAEWAKSRWLHSVSVAGLDATWEHGADVKDAWAWVAQYVAKWGREPKWGVDRELTKGHAKSGRVGGRSPNQLLSDYIDGDFEAGRLWLEYVAAFRGKSQLRWSKGLRDVLGLGAEVSDEQLARETDENQSRLLASITLDQWRVVLACNAVGDVLAVAQQDNELALWEFLESLPGMPAGAVFHPAFRSAGNLRVGDMVRWWDGSRECHGLVVELVGSRVWVDVWGKRVEKRLLAASDVRRLDGWGGE